MLKNQFLNLIDLVFFCLGRCLRWQWKLSHFMAMEIGPIHTFFFQLNVHLWGFPIPRIHMEQVLASHGIGATSHDAHQAIELDGFLCDPLGRSAEGLRETHRVPFLVIPFGTLTVGELETHNGKLGKWGNFHSLWAPAHLGTRSGMKTVKRGCKEKTLKKAAAVEVRKWWWFIVTSHPSNINYISTTHKLPYPWFNKGFCTYLGSFRGSEKKQNNYL